MKHIYPVIAAALAFFGTACTDTTQPAPQRVFPRISIVSQNSDIADVTVELEGNDGNLVSGAVVLVSNSVNGVLKCAYDSSTGAYHGRYPIPADGLFNIYINSVLSSILTYNIVHQQITTKPVITVFEDSGGASVLLGQRLTSVRDIQLGWVPCGEGIVYQVTVKDALRTLYQASTEGLTHIIPGGTLMATPGGQIYYIQITAQQISGDPFFLRSSYYSAVIQPGETLSFNVQ